MVGQRGPPDHPLGGSLTALETIESQQVAVAPVILAAVAVQAAVATQLRRQQLR